MSQSEMSRKLKKIERGQNGTIGFLSLDYLQLRMNITFCLICELSRLRAWTTSYNASNMRIVSYEPHLTWRFIIMFDLSTVSTRYLFQPSTVTNLPHDFLFVSLWTFWWCLSCVHEARWDAQNKKVCCGIKSCIQNGRCVSSHDSLYTTPHVCTSVKTPVVASKGANLVQSWRKRWMKAYVSKPWKTLAFATIQTAIRNDNWSRVERKTMKSSPIIVKDWRFRALSIDLIWVNRRPRKLCPTVAISNGCHPRTPVFIVFHDADSSLERHLKQLRCGCSPGTRQSYTQRLADLAAT